MKEKQFNTLEDLLAEESFRLWVMEEPGNHLIFWKHWITQNPDKKALVEEARLILKGIPFEFKDQPADSEIVQAEWEKLRKRTLNKDQTPVSAPKPQSKGPIRIRTWLWRAAASVALLALMGFLLQQYVLNPFVVHETPFGKQLSIVLPDSTAVELNANSMLTYRKHNPRKVWLDGEAFFEVKKKAASGANFLVITNDLTVEVLGTAFNVIEKAYKTEVILEEGSVKLNLKRGFEKEVFMEPGELVAFSAKTGKTGKKVKKQQVEPQPLTSWKDGVLVFEDVPLTQVMDRIEEIYGWRAVCHDKELETRNINFPLPSNDLESVLKLLKKAIGVEIEKVPEDKVLLLY